MNILLPVLALALAIASAYLLPRVPSPERPTGTRFIVAAALIAVALVGSFLMAKSSEVPGAAIGLLIGCVAIGAAAWTGGPVPALAFGVAGAAAVSLVGATNLPMALFALIASAGITSLALGGSSSLAAIAAAAVASATYLADQRLEHASGASVAIVVGMGAVVGAVLGSLVKIPTVRAILPAAGAMIASAFLGLRLIHEPGIAITVAAGAVAGLIVRALIAEEGEGEGLSLGIAALIWLGVATLAFGLLRGLGMSLALIGGLTVLIPGGARRAVLSVGVLAGLVLYRLLREAQPEASRALDIGQHYALVGLALGLIVPLLPVEWYDPRIKRTETGAAFLWGLLALGMPVLVLLVFGGVGAVGFIAGLGFSGLVQALRARTDLLPLPLGMGMAGTTVLLTGWLGTVTGLTRDEKLRVLGFAAVALVVIVGLLVVAGRRPKSEVPA